MSDCAQIPANLPCIIKSKAIFFNGKMVVMEWNGHSNWIPIPMFGLPTERRDAHSKGDLHDHYIMGLRNHHSFAFLSHFFVGTKVPPCNFLLGQLWTWNFFIIFSTDSGKSTMWTIIPIPWTHGGIITVVINRDIWIALFIISLVSYPWFHSIFHSVPAQNIQAKNLINFFIFF